MRPRNATSGAATLAALWLAGVVAAGAEPQPAPTPPPAQPESPAPAPDPKSEPADDPAPPTLDELLGLTDKPAGGERRADPDKTELERALNEEDVSEMFLQAVQQMADAADLLQIAGDPGLTTQRVQEEIIRKLEVLIDQAEQQQSQGSQQQGAPSGQQQQQRAPAQPQQAQQDSNSGDNREERLPPGRRDGALRELLDAAIAAWGSLPPRVRDVLLEGANDRFSSLYEQETEAYYRRLAEEAGDR